MLHTLEPVLPIGKVAPLFTLPDLDDQPVRRSAERGRRHQVLVLLDRLDTVTAAYLHGLSAQYQAIRAADSAILAVLRDPSVDADALKAQFDLPFPLLRDRDDTVWRRYLPAGATLGVFILDRYGALHAQWALAAPPLPSIDDLVEWLHVIDRQCSL
jgi:peroxiredoxin